MAVQLDPAMIHNLIYDSLNFTHKIRLCSLPELQNLPPLGCTRLALLRHVDDALVPADASRPGQLSSGTATSKATQHHSTSSTGSTGSTGCLPAAETMVLHLTDVQTWQGQLPPSKLSFMNLSCSGHVDIKHTLTNHELIITDPPKPLESIHAASALAWRDLRPLVACVDDQCQLHQGIRSLDSQV